MDTCEKFYTTNGQNRGILMIYFCPTFKVGQRAEGQRKEKTQTDGSNPSKKLLLYLHQIIRILSHPPHEFVSSSIKLYNLFIINSLFFSHFIIRS